MLHAHWCVVTEALNTNWPAIHREPSQMFLFSHPRPATTWMCFSVYSGRGSVRWQPHINQPWWEKLKKQVDQRKDGESDRKIRKVQVQTHRRRRAAGANQYDTGSTNHRRLTVLVCTLDQEGLPGILVEVQRSKLQENFSLLQSSNDCRCEKLICELKTCDVKTTWRTAKYFKLYLGSMRWRSVQHWVTNALIYFCFMCSSVFHGSGWRWPGHLCKSCHDFNGILFGSIKG